MSVVHVDPKTRESRVGAGAMAALRKGARARALVVLIWLLGLPVVLISVDAIPPIRIYALFFAAGYLLAGLVAIGWSVWYATKQQELASVLASQHLGIHVGGPLIPARVIRYGTDFIDAWLVGHGIRNPVTGLDSRGHSAPVDTDRSEPFRDRKWPTNLAIAITFLGLALLVPWGIMLIMASLVDQGQPAIAPFLVSAAFGFIVLGIVLIAVFSRARVRARVAWAESRAQQRK